MTAKFTRELLLMTTCRFAGEEHLADCLRFLKEMEEANPSAIRTADSLNETGMVKVETINDKEWVVSLAAVKRL